MQRKRHCNRGIALEWSAKPITVKRHDTTVAKTDFAVEQSAKAITAKKAQRHSCNNRHTNKEALQQRNRLGMASKTNYCKKTRHHGCKDRQFPGTVSKTNYCKKTQRHSCNNRHTNKGALQQTNRIGMVSKTNYGTKTRHHGCNDRHCFGTVSKTNYCKKRHNATVAITDKQTKKH